ncbi:MAG TPA: penicillin-binding transpeptidase domain-containing protein [Candidatus Paceibacterota bacterium]|nr:penicillin-binding transpeptidase domain-containing protein [Candidatus Paceibacterota bacterium]
MRFFDKIFRRRKHRYPYAEIAPDEIFLDSRNLPEFDTNQFEGRLEKPLSQKSIYLLGTGFLLIIGVFVFRLWNLQIADGNQYRVLAEKNRLDQTSIIASRGLIFDRTGKELVWNEKVDGQPFASRVYINEPGFSHVLGYVSYPQADSKGIFYRTDYIGKMGVEKAYDALLKGYNGTKTLELNALQQVVSQNVVVPPVGGQDLTLSIDARVQTKLYSIMKNLADQVGFHGGSGVIMDVQTGEILAMTSYPEYSSEVMVEGKDKQAIAGYNKNPDAPFLFRAVQGLYTPGSIVKPFLALGALNEGIISPDTVINTKGYISIPNPYHPDQPSIFNDWKNQGPINMEQALSVSSDVYFYEVGGGYQDQPGLGIDGIGKYMRMFGLGQPTGIVFNEAVGTIPNPDWKKITFPNDPTWRLGDTYHTAIGQYGVLVTPIQMVRAVAAIANNGKLLTPTILKKQDDDPVPYQQVPIPEKDFKVVQAGMRLGAISGTAAGLNMSQIEIAAKTGTAELDAGKKYTNHWVIGYYPYDHPKYAFAMVMAKGPYNNLLGGVDVARQLFDWMWVNTPEYIDPKDLGD